MRFKQTNNPGAGTQGFCLGDYMFDTCYIPLPAGLIADVITTALEEAMEKETMTIGKTHNVNDKSGTL